MVSISRVVVVIFNIQCIIVALVMSIHQNWRYIEKPWTILLSNSAHVGDNISPNFFFFRKMFSNFMFRSLTFLINKTSFSSWKVVHMVYVCIQLKLHYEIAVSLNLLIKIWFYSIYYYVFLGNIFPFNYQYRATILDVFCDVCRLVVQVQPITAQWYFNPVFYEPLKSI